MFIRRHLEAVLLLLLIFFPGLAFSQQDVAAVTGIVTDASGAVIRGVSITLQDTRTNSIYQAETNSAGNYNIAAVRPGPGYKITFSAPNFQSTSFNDVDLPVGITRTQNVKLGAESVVTIEVSAANQTQTLDFTDATIGNNLDIRVLNELPVQDRASPASLFNLQPGVVGGAVTGARTDQTTVTVDGLDANDIATGSAFAIVAKAPIDSVEEFRGTVAGQVASNGPGGGGQFQLITKSGTNRFHGDLNEYHRDNVTQANEWFTNNAGVARPKFIQNQFGGAIGGPIFKDKLFFFFDTDQSRIVQSLGVTAVVPLDSFRAGNISYVKAKDPSGAVCTRFSRQTSTPGCIGTLTPDQVASLDPQHIGNDPNVLDPISKRYPKANDLSSGDGVNTGGLRFTAPVPRSESIYVGKLDYNLNRTMKLFIRGTIDRVDATQAAIRFPGDPVSNPFIDRSYSYVVGHVWSIGTDKVNQFVAGDSISKFNFPANYNPTGTTQLAYGLFGDPYNGGSSQQRRVPVPEIRDDFNWQKGSHGLAIGGTFKYIKTNSKLVNDFNFTSIGLGGNTGQLDASLRPSDIRHGSSSYGQYDAAFALALGRIGAISSNYNFDSKGAALTQGTGAVRGYRFFETELYAGDTWKVNQRLTLTYGIRYQLYSVPYEVHGSQSGQTFTFDQYIAARVKQSAAGSSGDSSIPFITYNLGGKANGAAPIYQPSYKDFAPRVAFAYNPAYFKKLVVNGSAGIVYDRTVINAVNFIQDQSSYLFQNNANANYGVSSSATTSLLNDPRLGPNNGIPAPPKAPAITRPFTPYVDANGTPNGLANGTFATIVDPSLKDPYSISINAGIQQELPGDFILKVNYVGRFGRRLLAQADASQLIDFPDKASSQMLSTAFGNMTREARAGVTVPTAQPFFENQIGPGATATEYSALQSFVLNGDFADFVQGLASGGLIPSNVGMASQFAISTFVTNKGFSNYHGLLWTLSKNYSHGLKFDVNYTWSHSIDNTSAVANYIAAGTGVGFVCDVLRPRECRGNSDFDATNAINANFVYDLPVGRTKTFLSNSPRFLDEVIGGWSVSGIPTWQSGFAIGTVSNAYVAGYANNAPAFFNGDRNAVAAHAHKQSDGTVNLFSDQTKANASFTGPIGFAIGSRNNLRGPSSVAFDAGLAKTFSILPDDKLDLKFRADAFNVLNHPVFGNPNLDITSATFGQITATANRPRVAQFSLRLEF